MSWVRCILWIRVYYYKKRTSHGYYMHSNSNSDIVWIVCDILHALFDSKLTKKKKKKNYIYWSRIYKVIFVIVFFFILFIRHKEKRITIEKKLNNMTRVHWLDIVFQLDIYSNFSLSLYSWYVVCLRMIYISHHITDDYLICSRIVFFPKMKGCYIRCKDNILQHTLWYYRTCWEKKIKINFKNRERLSIKRL
jgi:hypothetical protein